MSALGLNVYMLQAPRLASCLSLRGLRAHQSYPSIPYSRQGAVPGLWSGPTITCPGNGKPALGVFRGRHSGVRLLPCPARFRQPWTGESMTWPGISLDIFLPGNVEMALEGSSFNCSSIAVSFVFTHSMKRV